MPSSDTISPLDNRYRTKISELLPYFSENAWINHRIFIEVQYFDYLLDLLQKHNYVSSDKTHTRDFIDYLQNNSNSYKISCNGKEIKQIEETTRHDIKAIEYWLRQLYTSLYKNEEFGEFIHFGLTSQDINSVAFSIQLKHSIDEVILPEIRKLGNRLNSMQSTWKDIPFLAMTHGQPAIPTLLGKEIRVFEERLKYLEAQLKTHKHYTKFGGAVGNLNAHYMAYPAIGWNMEMDTFCESLGLHRWHTTTQITNYDDIGIISGILISFSSMLIDVARDMWMYISRGIFTLRKLDGQVGSSTMPQKCNPIDFENAEGNLQLAITGFQMMQTKLPISRMQRDLSDSSVLRNYGTYLGHLLISMKAIYAGLDKLEINTVAINKELTDHPEILAEPIQIILRKYKVLDGYNIIRLATQNKSFNNQTDFLKSIISELKSKDIKDKRIIDEIRVLDVFKYCGRVSSILDF